MDHPRQSRPGPAFLIFERNVAPLLVVTAIVFALGAVPIAFLYWSGLARTGKPSPAEPPGRARWAPAPLPPSRTTIFSNVTIVPMDAERLLPGRDVLVRDGRIAAIARTGRLHRPDGVQVVDGAGGYLMPGLADMHVHLAYDEGDQAAVLELFAANGVTTVLNLQGMPSHLRLRERIAAGELLAPTLYTSGPYISNAPFYSPTADEAAAAVRDQKAAGYDLVKIHGDFSPEAYRAVIRAARREGLKVVGHAPRNIGMEPLLAERQDALAHVEEFIYAYYRHGRAGSGLPADVDALTAGIASRTREAGVQVIANLTAYRGIWRQAADVMPVLARPEVAYVPGAIRHYWEPERNTYVRRFAGAPRPFEEWYGVLERLVAALDRAGVPLMAGSDAPIPCVVPGFSLHDELRDLVAAGLTPYRALRAATAAPAAFLGAPHEFGSVRVGARADLILVSANPLEDVAAAARPSGVMLRGRWLDRPAIDARLRALASYATGSSRP